jgi:hypothetical protein
LSLCFLARSSCLCGCPIIPTWFLWVGIYCGLLCELGLFLLLLGRLRLILLPILCPCLHWPFVCLCFFSLAHYLSLRHLDFLRLCFSLPCLFFYCCFQQFLGDGWNPPFIIPFTDDHVNVTLYDTIAHL